MWWWISLIWFKGIITSQTYRKKVWILLALNCVSQSRSQTGQWTGSRVEWRWRSRTWHRCDTATDTQRCQGDRLHAVGGKLSRTRLMWQLWMRMLKRFMGKWQRNSSDLSSYRFAWVGSELIIIMWSGDNSNSFNIILSCSDLQGNKTAWDKKLIA